MNVEVRNRFVDSISRRRELLKLYFGTQVTQTPTLLLYRQVDRYDLRIPKPWQPPSQKKRRDQLLAIIAPAPLTAIVPNVVGLQLADAIHALSVANLVESEDFQQSLTVAADVIIGQSPAAGTTIPRGSSVALLVSLGASIVPNLIGDTLDQAVAVVLAAGLVPSTAPQPTNLAPPGTILGQLPGAGTAVLAGSVVSLIVAVATGGGGGPSLPVAVSFALQRGLIQDIWHYWGGDITVGNTGDLATVSGSLRGMQRVLRRLLTNPGEYIWHPDYGAGLPAQIGNTADIGKIKAIVRAALALEDSVAKTPPPSIDVRQLATDQTGFSITVKYADAATNADTVLSFTVSA